MVKARATQVVALQVGGFEVTLGLAPELDTGDLWWSRLWPSSIALAEALGPSGLVGAGARVLELGAGAGLAGVVAGLMGAAVTFSDVADEALALCAANARRNGLTRFERRRIDWWAPPEAEPFPLILGADLGYLDANVAPLADTLDRLLAPGGTALLADPIRSSFTRLLTVLRGRGFEHAQQLVDVRSPDGGLHRVGVYRVRRGGAGRAGRAPRQRSP